MKRRPHQVRRRKNDPAVQRTNEIGVTEAKALCLRRRPPSRSSTGDGGPETNPRTTMRRGQPNRPTSRSSKHSSPKRTRSSPSTLHDTRPPPRSLKIHEPDSARRFPKTSSEKNGGCWRRFWRSSTTLTAQSTHPVPRPTPTQVWLTCSKAWNWFGSSSC